MMDRNNMNEDYKFDMEMNLLVRFLGKEPGSFTKEDIINFIRAKGIELVNFCYPGADGRIKRLNFPVKNLKYLDLVLEAGERADGSSLFPYIDTANSDVYVVPRYGSAFLDPFSVVPSLNLMCSYIDNSGKPLGIGPYNIVKMVSNKITEDTGIILKALGELEYYVIMDVEDDGFPSVPQRNYHESSPFVKAEAMREEILTTLSKCGINVKYAHSEVGDLPPKGTKIAEQHEIELLPEPIEEMADHITIAKWIIRNIAAKRGVAVTFAPKIEVGHAGSGLHIHFCGEKDGRGVMVGQDGELSLAARQMIGGTLKYAKSITAFGNTIPTSFLRLVPHQEAPTKICWGPRNRSVLVRIPLGWGENVANIGQIVNYGEIRKPFELPEKQTFEIRSPDLSSNPYHLLSALGAAIHWGLTNPEESLKVADDLYLIENIFKDRKLAEKYDDLPGSCVESAKALEAERELYDKIGFPSELIDRTIEQLKAFKDENIREEIVIDPEKLEEYVEKYFHCG
ncbi:MAG: glutamine synthetase [Deltaproteobacteria bacterium]|nr:glutamine synthetase [Deltaproteobacteria bacterium]